MKRALSIVFALTLCLSLCACGSQKSPSKESFLDAATSCDFTTLYNDQVENPARAKSYCGQIYKVTGYIESISEDSVTVVPIDTPFSGLMRAVNIRVYFSNEDMLQLSKFAAINFVGKVEEIAGDYSNVLITMKEAFYIDDTIVLSGTVEDFVYNVDHGCTQMQIRTYEKQRGDSRANLWATYYVRELSKLESHEKITVKGATLMPGRSVKLTAKLSFDGLKYTDLPSGRTHHITFEVKEIISIS